MNSIAILKRILPFFAGVLVGVAPVWIIGGGSFSSNAVPEVVEVPVYHSGGRSKRCRGKKRVGSKFGSYGKKYRKEKRRTVSTQSPATSGTY